MAAYNFRGEWGFPISTPFALGDVVTYLGLFWRCTLAATKKQPGTANDWAPLANGALLAAKSYNPPTGVAPSVTATTSASAPAFDATNLALLQSVYPNLRVPESGRILVEMSAIGWVAAQAAMYWLPLSSSAAGSKFSDPNGNDAYSRVVDNAAFDTLRQNRVGSCIISGLTPGAVVNLYWGGFVSTSTGSITYGASTGAGPAIMRAWAVM